MRLLKVIMIARAFLWSGGRGRGRGGSINSAKPSRYDTKIEDVQKDRARQGDALFVLDIYNLLCFAWSVAYNLGLPVRVGHR